MTVAPASSGPCVIRSASAKPSISGIMRVEQDQRERLAAAAARSQRGQRRAAARRPRSAACPSWSASRRGCGGWWRCRRRPARGRPREAGAARRCAAGAGRPRRRPKRAVKWNVLPLPDCALDPDPPAHQLRPAATRSPGPGRCRRTCASSSRRPARRPRRSAPACSGGMPMPVSRTAKCSATSACLAVRASTVDTERPPRPSR